MLLRFNMQLQIVGFILLFAVTNEVSCECGISTLPGNHGDGSEPGIFPWHVLIYQRSEGSSYSLKCAGTLTKSDTVMSAAHCFYNETGRTMFDANSFKVVAGKYYTPYTWEEMNMQGSEIKTINSLIGYRGSAGLFSKDIAWLILKEPFNITPFVNPVCTDFDNTTDTRNLQSRQIGRTATCRRHRNNIRSAKLKARNFFLIRWNECMSLMPESRRPYMTDDKFCAVCLNNGITLSATNSGTGLHFQHNGKWYLRGVLSFINDSDTTYSGIKPLVFSDVKQFNYKFSTNTECGTTPGLRKIDQYISNGFEAEFGKLPWHVAIYEISPPGIYNQICSGTLISPSVVISVAYCFWDDLMEAKRNASDYAIAAGKFHRRYSWPEIYAQTSGIRDIYISNRYLGRAGNYIEDIACLILERPLDITHFVRPVCLDMSNKYEMEDLRGGRIGRVASWGDSRNPESSLRQFNLPYVEFEQCRSASPPGFIPYITFDKFCAGYINGSTLCAGDSGSGLVFRNEGRWYLRGITSVSPPTESRGESTCNYNYYIAFTNVGRYTEYLHRFANLNFNEIIQ